jgi:hypothetical protein
MKYGAFTIEVGSGMGQGLFKWIQSSFDNKHERQDGEILIMSPDYKVLRVVEFTDALITEVSLTKLDAKSGKAPSYLTIKFQPETVKHSEGGGGAALKVGAKQKLWADNMFKVDFGGKLEASHCVAVDSIKFTQKITEHAVGEFITSQYEPTSVEVSDAKFTFGNPNWKSWAAASKEWFEGGAKSEPDEITCGITIMAQDAKTEVAQITLSGMGIKKINMGALEANKEGMHNFEAELYVETIKLEMKATDL